MAYRDDLTALGFQHIFPFDGTFVDIVGSVVPVNTGSILTDGAICKDATNCVTFNGITDRVTIPNTTDINNGTHTKKVIAIWFEVTKVNQPFTRIYGEGNATNCFQIAMGIGNSITFEIENTGFNVQIYADTTLVPDRAYCLSLEFSGNGFDNIVNAYLDGIPQTDALPVDRQPDTASIIARTPCELGDPVGTVGLDGTAIVMVAPTNGKINYLCSGTGITLTETQHREEIFENGALPDATISSGTEGAMQIALDALGDARGNAPLCIEIEAVTGDGDLTLTSDKTFDALASCHIRYLGTGTLTWVNDGGDASIFSGNITIQNPADLTISDLVTGSEVRIYDDNGVNSNDFGTELDGIESIAGTSFVYSHSGVANDIVVQIIKDGYVEIIYRFSVSDTDQALSFNQKTERN